MITEDRDASHRPSDEAGRLWREAAAGSERSREQLLEMCYSQLRMLARRMLSGDSSAYRLQPTELANETVLRVLKLDRMEWRDRAHFLATAATVMRQTLLDEVRRFRAAKRQTPAVFTTWVDQGVATMEVDIERLDHSLHRLAAVSPERARLVELRFFVGLTIEATAEVLAISPATVKRQWDSARTWLLHDLGRA
ncbi:MAG: ECF-type sigma factor [Gammaproteobacteria bacterium]